MRVRTVRFGCGHYGEVEESGEPPAYSAIDLSRLKCPECLRAEREAERKARIRRAAEEGVANARRRAARRFGR